MNYFIFKHTLYRPICYDSPMEKVAKTWKEFFNEVAHKEYSDELNHFLNVEYAGGTIYPPRDKMFNAFKLTPLADVKVVIVGQDPYHEPGQAMGLSFSVPQGVKVPPSLINIYKEIERETGVKMDMNNGDLTYLAKQGVLLLNSILTVRAHQPMSHNIEQYHLFLEDVLTVLDKQYRPMVFLLWGGPARKLKRYLHNPSHLILECCHPSPLAANHGDWFGNGHFLKSNAYLVQNGTSPIKWNR